MDIAIIGAGIAGELTAYFLLSQGHRVTLYDPNFAPGGASWNSTGVVGTFGVTIGYSALGDLLSRAYEVAECFYRKFDHPSIGFHPLCYLAPTPSSSGYAPFLRRFGHLNPLDPKEGRGGGFWERGILIDAPSFMAELWERNHRSSHCVRVVSTVTSWQQVDAHQLIFYTPGALRFLLPLDGVFSKIRRGTFLQWQGVDHPETFHYDFYGRGSISYRCFQKKLLISSANGREMNGSRDIERAFHLYHDMNQLAPFALPPFSRAKICSGVRELAGDRLPKLQRVGEKCYSLTGLHRNGYTLAPFFARKFLDILLS